jgi:Ca2+-binding EF-hand superfamily protein
LCGIQTWKAAVSRLLAELDTDGSGDITFDEFEGLSKYFRAGMTWDQPLKHNIFETADTDKDSTIDIIEFRELLTENLAFKAA